MSHLVWFRNDCRVSDHAALTEACNRARVNNETVRAVFLWTPTQWLGHDYGTARHYSWSQALHGLNRELARLGIELTLLHADDWKEAVKTLLEHAHAIQAKHLYFHREFGWDEVKRDRSALDLFTRQNISVHIFEDRVSWNPEDLLTQQNEMYRVFTPFKKRWLEQNRLIGLSTPLPVPKPLNSSIRPTAIVPEVHWEGTTTLPLTEVEAHQRLDEFSAYLTDYKSLRDFPGEDGTSRLSAALANGAVSIRQCLNTALTHPKADSAGVQTWVSELIWREFYHYLLYWRPELATHEPFYKKWDAFPWVADENALNRWKEGRTGVPIVDAGMRQLAATGWMHNRVRMITAMYLVKLLQQDWRSGEAWFANQLLDIDFASNNGGWQWCASTGVDAAPYFRIFNPYTQSERFDPSGTYLRQWLPELSHLNDKTIHQPPRSITRNVGYPEPLVDYKSARASTLALFKQLQNG